MSWLRALIMTLLLLGAGCTSPQMTSSGTDRDMEPSITASRDRNTPTHTGSPTSTPTATSTPTSTPTPTPTPQPDNPWHKETVTVGIYAMSDVDRNYVPLVRDAIEFWNEEASEHGDYPVEYVLRPNKTVTDIEIRIVDTVHGCEPEQGTQTLGCAPLLSQTDTRSDEVTVRIKSGFSNESTIETIQHEIGHTRGLNHSYASQLPVMNASSVAHTLPQADAQNRSYPWRTDDFSVFIDDSNVSSRDRDEFRVQAKHAFDYYADGPKRAPANFSYTIVENESRADIVVRFVDDNAEKSTASRWGTDPDGDKRIEYYTNGTISIHDLDIDRSGFHIGYWIGILLGAEDRSQLPPPFQEDGAHPEDDWWK